ncbi:MAG: hypothetical protein ACFFAN_05785 [Promethearchaeota archaeon]
MKNSQKIKKNSGFLQILGFGLFKIIKTNSGANLNVIFQKGIGTPLIQNLIELYKKEIIDKKTGNSIIPLENFMIFIHYYEDNQGNITGIVYMDEKNNKMNYAKLYLISKKINNYFYSDMLISEIIKVCNDAIEIPRTKEIIAIFVLSSTGNLYYSKINKIRTNIAKSKVHISGFISVLFSFSKEIIDKEAGAKLKEINLGNQRFYMITNEKVIFTYLVEKINPLIQRYMYLIFDEFLDDYEENLKNFTGDLSFFEDFEKKINQYLII